MLATFLDSVQDRGSISARLLGDRLKMPMSRLAKLARVHRNTLGSGKGDTGVAQERLGEIAGLVARATELAGDETRAIVWFRYQPIIGFGGRTAEQLVAEGYAHAVAEYLEEVEAGGYA